MKNLKKTFSKIQVLNCEPKLESGTTRQALDKDGNKLFSLDVQEDVLNEKHGVMTTAINTYKSLVELEKGDHLVEVKEVNIADGNGSFSTVKSFFTVIQAYPGKTSLTDLFKPQGLMNSNQKSESRQVSA